MVSVNLDLFTWSIQGRSAGLLLTQHYDGSEGTTTGASMVAYGYGA